MPTTPVIDADGHVSENWEEFLDLLDPEIRPLAPWFSSDPTGRFRLVSIEGRAWVPHFELELTPTLIARNRRMHAGGTSAHDRVEMLDAEGIDATVVFPSLGLFLGLYDEPELAASMCRAQNRWLGGWCDVAPDRLAGVAVLPQQDPLLAAAELVTSVEQDGLVAAIVRPNRIAGRTLDDPSFDPLWATAARLDVPVVVHEGWMGGGYDTVGLDRVRSYGAAHAISHPFEQLTAVLGLVQSGVLSRFPSLRLGFFESGCGWAAWWYGRVAEHAELFPNEFAYGCPRLNERVWLTFEPEDPCVSSTVAAGWQHNLCFATDYPHLDATFPGAVETVRALDLDEDVEAALLGGNALRFFGGRLRSRLADPQP